MRSTVALKQIETDIYQLRLPLPFALDHVNVYLLEAPTGWTILDCGINWEMGRSGWQYAFDELGITAANIEKIVMTHVHPDHFGLSGWLYQQAQSAGREVPLYLSAREAEAVRVIWQGEYNEGMNFENWMRDNGMPDAMAKEVDSSMADTHSMTLPHPPKLKHIAYDETVTLGSRTFKAWHAPGHSDGQLIFHDEATGTLLSGDHILMKITPNIGLWADSDPNPLGLYLESLRYLSQLEVTRALPGHRQIIDDWDGRIGELLLHHQHRLDRILDTMEKGAETPFQIANGIFTTSRFSAHEWRFAIAETLAHLDYLYRDGLIKQDDDYQIFRF